MAKWLLFWVFCLGVTNVWAETFFVNAENGVVVRDAPDGKRLGKIPYGYRVEVKKKHNAVEVMDDAWHIQGHWVEIDFTDYLKGDDGVGVHAEKLFVFDGFLTPAKQFINQKRQLLNQYAASQSGGLASDLAVFSIRGDFFGDGIVDDVLMVRRMNGDVHLVILNHHATGTKIVTLGGRNDPFQIDSYLFEWSMKVSKGTPLWSNYTDDWRQFHEVPKNEIVKLPYDALYFHVKEACGGGFVYWKDNKWHWLQQE